MLAIATQFDMEIHHMDVITAFLNANLFKEIYMQQPEGYEGKEKPHKVCKLNKSIYGLKEVHKMLQDYTLSLFQRFRICPKSC